MNIELTEAERSELLRRKAYYPFRKWFIVKTASGDVEYFTSAAQANVHANGHAPAVIWAAQ